MEPLKIIDGHVNLASVRYIPKQFVESTASNMHHRLSALGQPLRKERMQAMLLGQYQDHEAAALVAEMDAVGVSEAVLLAPDFTFVADCELSNEEIIAKHCAIAAAYPGRFHVFAGVDPRSGRGGLEVFQRSVEQGNIAGMKLYPPAGYSPSDEALYPFYRICAEYGLPVLTHTGPGWHSLDFSLGHPMHVDKASRDFPTVNFILGHGGIAHNEEASYLCMYRENVYMDISGFPAVVSPEPWSVYLNRLFRVGLNHKIVFGTSWPASRMSISLASMIEQFRSENVVFEGVSELEKRLIMGGNIVRLLGARRKTVRETA